MNREASRLGDVGPLICEGPRHPGGGARSDSLARGAGTIIMLQRSIADMKIGLFGKFTNHINSVVACKYCIACKYLFYINIFL